MVRGHCEIVGSVTFICETWTVLLRVTSPAPVRFTTSGSSVRVVPDIVGLLHSNSCYSCFFVCASVCECVYCATRLSCHNIVLLLYCFTHYMFHKSSSLIDWTTELDLYNFAIILLFYTLLSVRTY